MGDKPLKEIRADLCKDLGIPDEELNAWIHRQFHLSRPKRKVRTKAGLRSVLKKLNDTLTRLEQTRSVSVGRNEETRVNGRKRSGTARSTRSNPRKSRT
jgi:hypothetical protein